MDYNKQLEHTRKYAKAFWEKEMIDRPYTFLRAPVKESHFEWSPANSYRAWMSGKQDSFFDDYIQWVDDCYWGCEAIPYVRPELGPDQYAAFFGGVLKDVGTRTTWFEPILEEFEDFNPKMITGPGSIYDELKKQVAYVTKRAEGHFHTGMLDLHSNMDCLAAMAGPENLCYSIMDEPEEVHRVLDAINGVYEGIVNMAWKEGNMAETGAIGWAPILCEGKFAVMQCDFSCMLSPEQAKEFVFPSIEHEASVLDHNVYHLDGKDALRHIDTILGMDCIDCIQWVPGAGQPRTVEWMDLLQKIQKAGKSVWVYDWTAQEVMEHCDELEPNKVCYQVNCTSREEAERLQEFLEKKY